MFRKICKCLSSSLLALAAFASSAAEPSHMAGMPDAVRVRADIQGDDPMDAAARQYAALAILVRTLSDLSDGRAMRRALTSAETERQQGYVQAMREIDREQSQGVDPACQGADCGKARFNRLQLRYSMNDTFRKEVFERLTAQAWRERHVKDWHVLVAQHGPTATSSPKLELKLELPAYTPPLTAAEAAARPMRSVFGLVLDQPLTVPPCPTEREPKNLEEGLARLNRPNENFCLVRNPTGGMFVAAAAAFGGQGSTILLPASRCPAWVACWLVAKTSAGRLTELWMQTRDVAAARTALMEKYGKPTRKIGKTSCNRLGICASYEDLEWVLEDAYVYAEPNGVTIKSPSLARREADEGDRKKANELKF
jgi:hypothetical protein